MTNKDKFQQPMKPWPGLSNYKKTIEIQGKNLTLFVFEAGENNKPVILMVHGLGDEADTWRHIFEPLAKDYHPVAVDLPGYGRSEKPKHPYSPNFLMKSLIELMDQLNIENAILMGSSLGGILSHGLAIEHPNRVQGLVLVGGAFVKHTKMHDRGLFLMKIPVFGEWLYTRLRHDPDAAYDSLRSVYHKLDSLPKADREFLYQRVNKRVWSNEQRRAYFSTLRTLIPWVKRNQEGLSEKLANLNIPTLVIRGEFDQLFPQEHAQKLVSTQPNASMCVVNGAGHLPHQEDPSTFLEILMAWLRSNYSAGN